ncbi:uncharacterized protein METZ01_LOCUS354163 [marine metagenome]|uniref:Uncharacterized protein n=1 Tax=marine metagenome TaxID=408172 RepID=A0A382RUG1_9ZZZZ
MLGPVAQVDFTVIRDSTMCVNTLND